MSTNFIRILQEIQRKSGGLTTDDLVPERLKRKPISGKSLKEALKITLANTFYETKSHRKFRDVHVTIKASDYAHEPLTRAVDHIILQCVWALGMPQWVREDWGRGELLDVFGRYRMALRVLKVEEIHDLLNEDIKMLVSLRIYHSKYRCAADSVTPLLLQAIQSRIDFYDMIPAHASKADNTLGNNRYMKPILADLKLGCYPSLNKAYMLWRLDETGFWTRKYRPEGFVDKIPNNFYLHMGLLIRRHKIDLRSWAVWDREGNQNKDMTMRLEFKAMLEDIVAGWDRWVAAGNEDPVQLPREWFGIYNNT